MAKTRSSVGEPEAAIDSRTSQPRRRLSKSAFNRVYEEGRRASGRFFRITTLPGEGRFGVATPKSVGCHARRNRLKRRTCEAFRADRSDSSSLFDVVVSANATAEAASFVELKADLQQTLQAALARWDEN